MYGWFDLNLFLGRLRHQRFTSNQKVVYKSLPGGTSSPYIFPGHNDRDPYAIVKEIKSVRQLGSFEKTLS